jgi:hypothetical protein
MVQNSLENNYEIKIAQNDLKIDESNVSRKCNVTRATASIVKITISKSSQTRADGTTNSLDNAKNNRLNYGVSLDWTIFDGLECFMRPT